MKEYAILVDSTYCTGCNTCMYKCVQENRLHASAARGLVRTFVAIEDEGLLNSRCMHCQTPACVEVCPEKAIKKTEYGPVLYDAAACIGCEACVEECPFGAPKLDPVTQKIVRCSMCAHRIADGRQPACVEACPTGALMFGEYREMAGLAEKRAKESGLSIYGLKENGGTHVLILTPVEPAAIGYPKVSQSAAAKTRLAGGVQLPAAAILVAGGLKKFSDRRARVEAEEGRKE